MIVFEWSGQPVAVLDFEDYVIDIAVSPDGHEIFAMFDSPAPMIVRYAVPRFPHGT